MERAGPRGRLGGAPGARRRATAAARSSCAARATTAATGSSPRGARGLGSPRRRRSSSATASTRRRVVRGRSSAPTSLVDAMFGTGFRGALEGDAACGGRRDRAVGRPVRRGRHPVGRRRAHRRGRTGRRCAAAHHRHVRGARSRARCSSPAAVARGRGRRSPTSASTSATGALRRRRGRADVAPGSRAARPDTHKWAVGGVIVVGGSRRHDRRADAREPRRDAGRRRDRVVRGAGRGRGRAASGTEVITRALPATADGALDADAATAVLAPSAASARSWSGPGLGHGRADRGRGATIVADAPVAARARRRRAQRAARRPLAAAVRQPRATPTVLTPHDGEYARLAGARRRARPGRRGPTARRREPGSVVLLKGPGTVDRRARRPSGGQHRRAAPGWPTAGTGDVLSGIIGALLARGLPSVRGRGRRRRGSTAGRGRPARGGALARSRRRSSR